MQHTMVAGTTEPQDFQLYSQVPGQAIAALVGTGLTVTMQFLDSGVSATVAWLVQASGTVRVTDVTGVQPGQTYRFRFKLVDGSSKVAYSPNGKYPDELFVTR